MMNDVLAMTGNKQLSERSKRSLASRFSNVSARRAPDTLASPKNNLEAIKEEEPLENDQQVNCEVCRSKF